MVFGLFEKGNINVSLEKTNFVHGETINGKVTMILKKPVKARGITATLLAERTVTSYSNNGVQRNTQRAFSFSVPLDTEKEYPQQQYNYDFKIQVPEQAKVDVEGKVGTAIKALTAIGNMMSPLSWFIEIKLDVPGGFDISKRQQIMVAQGQA